MLGALLVALIPSAENAAPAGSDRAIASAKLLIAAPPDRQVWQDEVPSNEDEPQPIADTDDQIEVSTAKAGVFENAEDARTQGREPRQVVSAAQIQNMIAQSRARANGR